MKSARYLVLRYLTTSMAWFMVAAIRYVQPRQWCRKARAEGCYVVGLQVPTEERKNSAFVSTSGKVGSYTEERGAVWIAKHCGEDVQVLKRCWQAQCKGSQLVVSERAEVKREVRRIDLSETLRRSAVVAYVASNLQIGHPSRQLSTNTANGGRAQIQVPARRKDLLCLCASPTLSNAGHSASGAIGSEAQRLVPDRAGINRYRWYIQCYTENKI